ncbi:hypothetical protein MTO96_035274 [Rhipicephalus appendiculatus]
MKRTRRPPALGFLPVVLPDERRGGLCRRLDQLFNHVFTAPEAAAAPVTPRFLPPVLCSAFAVLPRLRHRHHSMAPRPATAPAPANRPASPARNEQAALPDRTGDTSRCEMLLSFWLAGPRYTIAFVRLYTSSFFNICSLFRFLFSCVRK